MEYCFNCPFLADRGIHHQVKAVPFGPFNPKVLLDERCPIAVHGLGKLDGFTLALPSSPQASDLLFKRSIHKYMKYIGAVVEIVCRAAAYDDALTALRSALHHALSHYPDAISIGHF